MGKHFLLREWFCSVCRDHPELMSLDSSTIAKIVCNWTIIFCMSSCERSNIWHSRVFFAFSGLMIIFIVKVIVAVVIAVFVVMAPQEMFWRMLCRFESTMILVNVSSIPLTYCANSFRHERAKYERCLQLIDVNVLSAAVASVASTTTEAWVFACAVASALPVMAG